tara:strand:- start:2888 stop:3766 length:879 start_codon:yes stop_codon:yes gene_type:complete
MNSFKSHFKFNKQERSGIFFLLLIIVVIQISYYFFSSSFGNSFKQQLSLNQEMQDQVAILKQNSLKKDTIKLYPFNPNFITDYKGYKLGMSLEEINRLFMYRAANKYVNSSEEFQKITLVSDSLLQTISPYFKFPEWIVTAKNSKQINNFQNTENNFKEITIKDLNTVTINELKTVNGIGDKLSARIIKFRDKLGGFLIDDQLYDVYGLDVEVVQRVFKKYKVLKKPEISKININTASLDDIAKIVYIQKGVAQRIVEYRNSNKSIRSFDELLKIEEFPVDKIDRIKLYLSL